MITMGLPWDYHRITWGLPLDYHDITDIVVREYLQFLAPRTLCSNFAFFFSIIFRVRKVFTTAGVRFPPPQGRLGIFCSNYSQILAFFSIILHQGADSPPLPPPRYFKG